ncbi:hypothetical protein Poli38472_013934 [Pythium oligandrum]|uniref:Calmodulin n=1 Tax=Pythium oligandrum TaxID=41045 RepID=A0A8K1FD43_PYTOL|nr:hypothetical protein Poli38472_013934 [Pythium oligandrum]|eukprot:TMW55172.1 hypothetical protein Poli38472_013934 [Pythium oligandrum]
MSLCEQELRETIHAAFAHYDEDGSGTIDIRELRRLIEDLGGFLSDDELNAAVVLLDRDGNGTIDESEFARWWQSQSADLDGDGDIGTFERTMARIKDAGQIRFRVDIHTAAWRGLTDVVERLLQEDAELAKTRDSTPYGNQNTALHYAAYQGHTSTCAALIAAGTSVNVSNASGCTPLFLAAQQARKPVVELLLQHGADTRIAEREHNFTAIDVCTDDDVLVLFQALSGGAPPPPPTSLRTRVDGSTIITLSWEMPSCDDLTHSVIQMSMDASGDIWKSLNKVEASLTELTISNLFIDRKYRFRVAVESASAGTSAFSSVIVARTRSHDVESKHEASSRTKKVLQSATRILQATRRRPVDEAKEDDDKKSPSPEEDVKGDDGRDAEVVEIVATAAEQKRERGRHHHSTKGEEVDDDDEYAYYSEDDSDE